MEKNIHICAGQVYRAGLVWIAVDVICKEKKERIVGPKSKVMRPNCNEITLYIYIFRVYKKLDSASATKLSVALCSFLEGIYTHIATLQTLC